MAIAGYPDDDFPEEGEEDEDDSGDPCDHCGPECKHWMGDNLCEEDLDRLEKATEEFKSRYVNDRLCPVCNKSFKCYQIPGVDELWHWPGDMDWRIAVDFWGILQTPKGVIHSKGNVYHIWTYAGEYREEKLIQPLGKGVRI